MEGPWLARIGLAAMGALLHLGGAGISGALLGMSVAAPSLVLQPWPRIAGEPLSSALLLQFISPGLFAADVGSPFSLVRFGQIAAPWPSSYLAHVGLLALLLAGYGIVGGRGPAAWAGRFALACGLAGALAPLAGMPVGPWTSGAGPLLVAALGLLAGCGLEGLIARRIERGAMFLSAASVLCAGVLAVAATQAGASQDIELLTGWLGSDVAPTTPAAAAPIAAALRTLLDRAALSSFAAMTALLLFLKSRGKLVVALLIGVAAADAALPFL